LALSNYAQSSTTYQGHYQKTPLLQILTEWENAHQLYFSYSPDDVANVQISTNINTPDLSSALSQLLRDTDLDFSVRQGRFVSLFPSPWQDICLQLIDSTINEPVSYASAFLPSHNWRGLSDEQGYLRFSVRAKQQGIITITHLGYQNCQFSLSTLPKGPCLTRYLQPKPTEVQTVVISEYLTEGISYEQGAIQLDPDRIEAMPGLTEPDVFRMIQALPGINAPAETAMGLYVRGGSPDQTLLYVDDIPLYQSGHFFDMISSINPFAIDAASVYRGQYGVQENGGVSGLVKVSQAEQIPQKTQYGALLNLTQLGLDADIVLQKERASLHLSARRSFTDFITTYTFRRFAERVFQETPIGDRREDDELQKENDIYRFQDASLKLLLQPSPQHKISLSAIVGANKLDFVGEYVEDSVTISDELQTQSVGLSLDWQANFRPQYQLTHTLSYSDYRSSYGFDFLEQAGGIRLSSLQKENAIQDFRFLQLHEIQHRPGFTSSFGYEARWQKSLFEIQERSPWGSYDEYEEPLALSHAFFTQHQWQWREKWFLQTGLRLTYHGGMSDWFLAPRLDLHYRLRPWLTLKANAGRFHQFIAQLEEFTLDDDVSGLESQIWVVAEADNFPQIQSDQFALGVVINHEGWLFDLELYHKQVDNLNSYSRAFGAQSILGQEFDYVVGSMQSIGMDVLLKKRWEQHLSWVSYSLSRILYDFPELEERPFFAPQDQRHILTLNHSWSLKKWQFAASWLFRSGRPFTPRVGDITEVELEEEEEDEVWYRVRPQYGAFNSERLPAYHRLDLTILYPLQLKKTPRLQGQVALSLQNLYNRDNIHTISYFTTYYEEQDPEPPESSIEVQKSLLLFIPNLSLRLEW
ncbi:MAG: TonB-dependent receptor, partial [Bacteroidota bacterium]